MKVKVRAPSLNPNPENSTPPQHGQTLAKHKQGSGVRAAHTAQTPAPKPDRTTGRAFGAHGHAKPVCPPASTSALTA